MNDPRVGSPVSVSVVTKAASSDRRRFRVENSIAMILRSTKFEETPQTSAQPMGSPSSTEKGMGSVTATAARAYARRGTPAHVASASGTGYRASNEGSKPNDASAVPTATTRPNATRLAVFVGEVAKNAASLAMIR